MGSLGRRTCDKPCNEMDPRLTVLKEKQEAMEDKINELRDMNRKRDEELQNIKETITDCKNKVMGIKCATMSLGDGASLRSVDMRDMDKNKEMMWTITDPRNLKILGGLMILHYVLSHGACFSPWVSGIFSYVYAFVTFYHFVIVTGIPLAREYILQGNLDDGTFQKVDGVLMPWYHLIGAILSLIAIQILTMSKCQGWCITNSIQILTRLGCYCLELGAYCYPELERKSDQRGIGPVNKITACLLGANVLTFIAPI